MSVIEKLDPKRDMTLIRERIERLLAAAQDPGSTMTDLARRNPVALADMVVGPKAILNSRWGSAALGHLDTLESTLAPNGLYRRLVSLYPELGLEILTTASRRHPAASWLIELSRKIEGQDAGYIHLTATSGHPAFTQNCWTHAAAGHLPGLLHIAETTGRPEPAAALAVHGHLDAAALCLIGAIEKTPTTPVVALVAAAWGPDISVILHKTLPHLRSKKVGLSLLRHTQGYAEFSKLLETVVGAMVRA